MTDWKIPLTSTTLGEEEALAAAAVVRSGWLTQGEGVAGFEREFADFIGVPHAIAVANCTLGLEIAYAAAGVTAGDEVVVPALTFVATANAARRLGARPVFADITSADDLCLDPEDAARRVTARTRAVVAVHYAGFAADIAGLRQALDARGAQHVAIIEDCAHAPGARTGEGTSCGALGDIGVFSFFSNKNMTTGEGGMLTTRDEATASTVRLLRAHGMTTSTWDRHRGHAASYDVVRPGTNARMDEIRAAIGKIQLARLPAANAARASVAGWYDEEMARRPALATVHTPFRQPRGKSCHHLYVVVLPLGTDRAGVMAAMRTDGVQTSVHYPPTHRFTAYGDPSALPRTDELAPRLLTLPLGPSMTPSDVESVLDALARALVGTSRPDP